MKNRKKGIKVLWYALNRVQLQRSLAVEGNIDGKNGDWFHYVMCEDAIEKQISLEDRKSNGVLNKTHHWILV